MNPPTQRHDYLATSRLMPPRGHHALLARRHLQNRLLEGEASIALLLAPAGFGKTSLLRALRTELLARNASVAWLSTQATERSCWGLLTGIVASLRHSGALECARSVAVLAGDVPSTDEDLRHALAADLCEAHRELWLLLDGVEAIVGSEAEAALEALLEVPPPNLHVALGSQVRPGLPFARWAGRGSLLELGVRELCLSAEETRQFMLARARSQLDENTLARLHETSGGWPAGLQLAAMAVNGGVPLDRYLERDRGLDRDAAAYLAETVLGRVPAPDLELMRCTAIAERFDAGLASALCARAIDTATLERIRAAQPFMQRLEAQGDWYEYHRAFRDWLLRLPLPAEVDCDTELHRRAARWFEQNGNAPDAVHHALACSDLDTAARLLYDALVEAQTRRTLSGFIQGWTAALPRALILHDQRVCARCAFGLAASYRFDDARALLAELEGVELLPEARQTRDVVYALLHYMQDETAAARMPGIDPPRVSGSAVSELTVAATFSVIDALSRTHAGDYEGAREALLWAHAPPPELRNTLVHVYALVAMSFAYTRRAHFHDAATLARESERIVAAAFPPYSIGAAAATAMLAHVLYEQGDIEALEERARTLLPLIAGQPVPELILIGYRCLARIAVLDGQHAQAGALLDELEALGAARGLDRLRAIAVAERLRLALIVGSHRGLHAQVERLRVLALPYRGLRHDARRSIGWFADLAGARFLMATDRVREAAMHLRGLLNEMADEDAPYALAQVNTLLARALWASEAHEEALQLFGGLVREGEASGLFRVFLDEGCVAGLLAALREASTGPRPSPAFLDRLVLANSAGSPQARSSVASPQAEQGPLTAREREVLALLGGQLRNDEIARALGVSADTVKYHLKNIYAKLGVRDRRAAAIAARSL